ncbi:hypothetical protein ES704_03480 [subsurface metagenome]|jgi:hypothetical protein
MIKLVKVEPRPVRHAVDGELSKAIAFVPEECYFPTDIKVDEEFVMKFVCLNKQDKTVLFWLGVLYKGERYLFEEFVGGKELPPATYAHIEFVPATMRKFLEEQGLEEFKESKTISIDFECGFFEEETYYYTDRLHYDCYVEVLVGLRIPWYAYAIAGSAVVGIVLYTTKPWK